MQIGTTTRRVAIIGGVRTPFARSHGAYAGTDNQELLTASLRALVERFDLQGQRLGDVIGGAVIKHAKDYNLTRESLLSTGLDPQTPGLDVQRACGTSLEAAILVANKIALGQIDAGIAAGVDNLSDPPVVYPRSFQQLLLRSGARPQLRRTHPALAGAARARSEAGAARGGRTAHRPVDGPELRAHGQDLEHHPRGAGPARLRESRQGGRGLARGLLRRPGGAVPRPEERQQRSRRHLARQTRQARPVFDLSGGSLTAGNSTPLTDGSAALLLASEQWAAQHKLPVLAYLRAGKTWAVDFASGKEGLLMAPAYAVAAILQGHGL